MENPTESNDPPEEERKPAPRSKSAYDAESSTNSLGDRQSDDETGTGATGGMTGTASTLPTRLSAAKQPAVPMLTARKREYKTLAELDAMADELRVAAMPADEKSRQMGLIYSRRKRLRKQKRVDDLMIQRDEIRSDIRQLQRENEHLRSLREACLAELSRSLQILGPTDSLGREQIRAELASPSLGRATKSGTLGLGRLHAYEPSLFMRGSGSDTLESMRMLRFQQAIAAASQLQRPSEADYLLPRLIRPPQSPITASSTFGSLMADLNTSFRPPDALSPPSVASLMGLNTLARPRDPMQAVMASRVAAARELDTARQIHHQALMTSLNQTAGRSSPLEGPVVAARQYYNPGLPLQHGPTPPFPSAGSVNVDLVRHQDRLERLTPAELSAFLNSLRTRTSPLEKILDEFERKKTAK